MGTVVDLMAFRNAKKPPEVVISEGTEDSRVDVDRVRTLIAWRELAEDLSTPDLAAAIEGVSAWRRSRSA